MELLIDIGELLRRGCCSAVSGPLGVWRRDHKTKPRPLKKGRELAGAGVSEEVQ